MDAVLIGKSSTDGGRWVYFQTAHSIVTGTLLKAMTEAALVSPQSSVAVQTVSR